EPGKTVEQFVQWTEKMQGPPPGSFLAGVAPMSAGEASFITLDLSPGEYGLICFFPDSKDMKPHFMHGMMKQGTVMLRSASRGVGPLGPGAGGCALVRLARSLQVLPGHGAITLQNWKQLKAASVTFPNRDASGFVEEVKQRVSAHFQALGKSQHA